MDPTPERFRRLARSAPYRWRSVVLEGTWGPQVEPARVRAERPDRLRVERLDGVVVFDGRQGSIDEVHPPMRQDVPDAGLDADGLSTAERRPWDEGPCVPYWQDYRFVAVLDPYELSDGVDVLDVRGVEHGGRPAWQALLRPTPSYAPRCSCCPLMRTRHTDLMEGQPPLLAYAETHEVVLDVGTGICVRSRARGGPADGEGHELVLLESDP